MFHAENLENHLAQGKPKEDLKCRTRKELLKEVILQ
jgi:hypothetical protein